MNPLRFKLFFFKTSKPSLLSIKSKFLNPNSFYHIKLKDSSSFLEEHERTILVNPNLGHPLFLTMDPSIKRETFRTELLFISNVEDIEEFKKIFKKRINFIPILEYKWRFKLLLEKRKKDREYKKIGRKKIKKKGIWAKFKFFFMKIKLYFKKKEIVRREEEKEKKVEAQLEKLKPRTFRGIPIIPKILGASEAPTISIDKSTYIDNEYTSPQDYLLKYKSFGTLNRFYKVTIEFRLTAEVYEFLKRRTFVMFDIIIKDQKKDKRINYHSLVISKKDWNNIIFLHATDLHLAERNDQMYGVISYWYKVLRRANLKILTKWKTLKEKNEDLEEKEKKSLILPDLSFKKRLINPNNEYRRFIKEVNRKVLHNKVDFVVITGDIVDYTIFSRLPKELQKLFDYKYSNWQVFKNITLNQNQSKRKGIMKGEELLCPIFTVPGNHDYRPYAYNLNYFFMYKKLGLKLVESQHINELSSAVGVTSIVKTNNALKAYWKEINPSSDFSLKLGKNLFIFLDSGPDSYKNLRDFVSGHPSVTGITDKQIKYLENLINSKISDEEKTNVFLNLHGPPVNPKEKRGLFKRFVKIMGKSIKVKLDEFKESLLKLSKKDLSDIRIDGKFDVKFGAISSNWEKMIKFCKDFTVLTLSGHTHDLKEFRLAEPPEAEKTKIPSAPPFILKKIENPAAIYYDVYSKILRGSENIERYGPYVVQTPALGLKSFKGVNPVGLYRTIKVKDGKLYSFKVKSTGNLPFYY